jgi:uncharacterized membrane protein YkvA (DUF1232 family)
MTTGSQDESGVRELLSMARQALRLMGDPNVPRWQKAIPVLALVYFISPFDPIPDFLPLPIVAQLDDLAVMLIALRLFLSLAGKQEGQQVGDAAGPDSGSGAGAGAAAAGSRNVAETLEAPYRVREE